jgi:ABC-type polysaccharide/polyol phosphate export permease
LADTSTTFGLIKQQANLVWILSLKNFKLRYKNSILGFMWSLITPMIYLAIFTFIFSKAFPDVRNYPLYALTGLIFWNFYSGASIATINSVIDSRGVLKSIKVNTIALPMAEVLTSLINLMLSLIPFGILMFVFGAEIGFETPLIIPALLLFTLFTLGVGLFICAFNVYFRDVGILYTSLTPALFYFTPIAYSAKLIPAKFAFLVKLNPLYHFIELFRTILYFNEIPSLNQWLLTLGLALVFFFIGLKTFRGLEKGFISNF